MANIILCHGINEDNVNKDTLDQVKPFLQMHHIQEADYEDLKLPMVRFLNNNLASMLAGMANNKAVGIGHSNGCAILLRAACKTNKIKRLVLINPALDNDVKFPDSLDRIDVYHNRHDDVVTVSSWLWWHEFGDMGNVGYKGDDIRVNNHETFEKFCAIGHSDVLNSHAECLMRDIKKNGILV